jgi:neurotransmitter:Na+ symporter, NSS family
MATVTFAILSYYIVIRGWILSYLIATLASYSLLFDDFIDSPYPVLSFVAVLGADYAIIRTGVSRGIGRLSKISVILLIALMVPITILGLFLPSSEQGVSFFLNPDFERLYYPNI